MKRIILLAAGLLAAPAFAGPAGNWLEVDYGIADIEDDSIGTTPVDDELSQRLAAQMGGDQGMFLRVDFRQDSVTLRHPGIAGQGSQPGFPPIDAEHRRRFLGLSIGRTVAISPSVGLTGEIGYGRVQYFNEQAFVVIDTGTGDAVDYGVHSSEPEEDTPFARLALGGPVGSFDWSLEAEYLDAVPQRTLPLTGDVADSELWWNARFGYTIAKDWSAGLRYADSDLFTATSISLRWTP